MLTASRHTTDPTDRFNQNLIANSDECLQAVNLQFDAPPSINCQLHGTFFFLSPGIVEVGRTKCPSLLDAIPMLHRLEIDHTPGNLDDQITYSSRLLLDQSAIHYWNDRNVRNRGKKCPHLYPKLPFGSLLDTQQQFTMKGVDDTMLIIDSDNMDATRSIRLEHIAHQSGRLLAVSVEESGRWTWVFGESTSTTETIYRIVEYGPGPNPEPKPTAIFRGETSEANVKIFRSDDRIIVIISTKGSLLFHLVTVPTGLTAVYQSDPLECLRIVNAFGSEDKFIDCIINTNTSTSCEYNIAKIRKGDKEPCFKMVRYSLLQIAVEEARFDGAAGQLERFPTASYHYLSEHCADQSTMTVQGYHGIPYRYAYGKSLNSIRKIDTVERGIKKGEEWQSYGCFPSPCIVIRQPGTPAVISECPYRSPSSSPEKITAEVSGVKPNISFPISTQLKSRSDSLVTISRSTSSAFYNYEDDVLAVSMVRDMSADTSFVIFLDGHDMSEAGRIVLPNNVNPGITPPLWIQRDS